MGFRYSSYPFLTCPERGCTYMTKKLRKFAEHVESHGKTLPFEVSSSGWLFCRANLTAEAGADGCDFKTKNLEEMLLHSSGHWPHLLPRVMREMESAPMMAK